MHFDRIGGLAALVCAGTYLFGFAFLLTFLAPIGFGTSEIDGAAAVQFFADAPGMMILFNSVIYLLNALALAVLVVALHHRLRDAALIWAEVTRAFGLIWAALVLGAGMIGNVTVEQVARMAAADPAGAEALWRVLHSVESGLGGGNEIAGGAWIACVSFAAWHVRRFGPVTAGLGVLTGLGGVLTLIPSLGDVAGAVFGLGAIAWFIAVGIGLMKAGRAR